MLTQPSSVLQRFTASLNVPRMNRTDENLLSLSFLHLVYSSGCEIAFLPLVFQHLNLSSLFIFSGAIESKGTL
jgi:hypothetical protein